MRARLPILLLLALPAAAQLSRDQRLSDFRNLADLYARRYAAVEWKKSALNHDLLDLSPWLSRVADATSDLEFYGVMSEYVSSLQDAHDQYAIPSDFQARLDITLDVYDGKLLIDSIDRKPLPAADFPFEVGDEVLSVDGKSAADLLGVFSKYVSGGNPRTTLRFAAEMIASRNQVSYPWAHEIGETAAVEIRRRDGATTTYALPWNKSGTPLLSLGPSAGPFSATAAARRRAAALQPSYGQALRRFAEYRLPGRTNVTGFGRLAPVFALPNGFIQGLGSKTYDSFFTGSYTAEDGTRIGYLRIPDFGYPSMRELDGQIAYFKLNTDVLVVDVMRNPGGDVCSAENILSRLTTREFFGAWAEVRVTWTDILELNYEISDPWGIYTAEEIEQLKTIRDEYREAYEKKQGRTRPIPICGPGAVRAAALNAYDKPVLILADEMSASSADMFAAMVQDNKIAPIFGYRTMGAGGSPMGVDVGVYSEGYTRVTRTLAVRTWPVSTDDFPTSSYVENVGVRPDIPADYMTLENLLGRGEAFVKAFTAEAVKLAKRK